MTEPSFPCEKSGEAPGDVDAIVVALKSRTIAPQEAEEQSLEALRWLQATFSTALPGEGPALFSMGEDSPFVRDVVAGAPQKTYTWRLQPGTEDLPCTALTGHGALAYAKWVGGRRPTKAEWEKAARGGCDTVTGDCSDGNQMRKYPWDAGDGSAAVEPSGCLQANWVGCAVATGTSPGPSRSMTKLWS